MGVHEVDECEVRETSPNLRVARGGACDGPCKAMVLWLLCVERRVKVTVKGEGWLAV